MIVTIEHLLKAKSCEEVFPNNANEAKEVYKTLAKKFHPDINKDERSEQAFKNLQRLYTEAKKKIEKGIWELKDALLIQTINGKKISFKYLSSRQFELGKIYVANTHILYEIDKNFKKYFDNAIRMIRSIKYEDKSMEDRFKIFMPRLVNHFQSVDNKYFIVLEKNPDEYMLSDVLLKNKEKFTDRHIAWILSRLNNINCFLGYNKIVHNGINPNNCFINPQNHSISLYGGWWYAQEENKQMIGTTSEIFAIMPIKNKTEKIALHSTDTESIRFMAKNILYNKKEVPKAMLDWIEEGSSENPFKEFQNWDSTLTKAYGARKFVKLNITKSDVYE